jgi:hypothetical protein
LAGALSDLRAVDLAEAVFFGVEPGIVTSSV